ncbi:ABC transporter substrate-binding protein [Streptacidiphilus sp. P02-A3a]|uniref:ABC transporter substrate-binding protein n=1 Tax=Streptacidiphilus sp. P02-A3a TaxID=2704468 RepID=UPI0015F9644D|nr:ABC transporter substrate-binding protein [Streptacidiphilus sp. P02-A3a]QMU69073.1 ABC transporter substrate-binding protein [Streptacidiphilus sp. P02-A3a]
MSEEIPNTSAAEDLSPEQPSLVEANVDLDAAQGVSRRRALTLGGVGLGVVAAAGLGSWAFIRSDKKDTAAAGGLTVTKSWAGRELAVTAPSGVCDAPLIVAYEQGFFRRAGLNVVLRKTGTDEDVTAAVGSGKYVATNGIFFNFLGPIYNGTPVKLSGGLHHGCLDLYVRDDGSVPTIASLRGKRIGVSNLQGSATNFFSLDLLDAGINSSPAAKQVEWVVIEQDLLPEALQEKKVDAIATAGGYLPIIQGVKAGWARELSNNRNLSRNASYPCCAVALNEEFVSQDPVTAAKLVNAWAQGSRWAGANLQQTARIESEKHYIPDTPANILPVLQTLTFDPSPRNLQQDLEPGIQKFIHTGFLPADTNAQALADKVFVNLGLNF